MKFNVICHGNINTLLLFVYHSQDLQRIRSSMTATAIVTVNRTRLVSTRGVTI